MSSESLDLLRKQIKNRARFKYPKMPNFELSDNFIKEKMKLYKGNIDKIVDEVYKITRERK